jgi:hypothetical protein
MRYQHGKIARSTANAAPRRRPNRILREKLARIPRRGFIIRPTAAAPRRSPHGVAGANPRRDDAAAAVKPLAPRGEPPHFEAADRFRISNGGGGRRGAP